MNICLLMIGQTENPLLKELIEVYVKRLNNYVKFDIQCIPALKNTKKLSFEHKSYKEGQAIIKALKPTDRVFLLDEHGTQMKSKVFAQYMQKQLNSGVKKLVFIIGGAYGFSEDVKSRAQGSISLSIMTFNHQMVRLFMVEQCYRAFSILRGEPYHND